MSSIFKKKIAALTARNFFSLATIELTTRCNIACKYCYISSPADELSTPQLHSVIDRLVQSGVLALSLTGGEPFIREDIVEILEHIFSRNFFNIYILTNGSLIRDEHIDILSRHVPQIGYIRFSFFSHRASVHDSFTGTPGSFDRSLKNALALQDAGITVNAIVNLTEDNIDTIGETKEYFLQHGMNPGIGLLKISANDQSRPIYESCTTRSFYSRYFNQLPENERSSIKRIIDTNCSAMLEYNDSLCEKLFGLITIRANGDIVPCITFRNHSMGNITTDDRPLQTIYRESELLKKLRSLRRSDLTTCEACKFIDYCTHCPGMMFSTHQSYTKPLQQNCNYLEALYETEPS